MNLLLPPEIILKIMNDYSVYRIGLTCKSFASELKKYKYFLFETRETTTTAINIKVLKKVIHIKDFPSFGITNFEEQCNTCSECFINNNIPPRSKLHSNIEKCYSNNCNSIICENCAIYRKLYCYDNFSDLNSPYTGGHFRICKNCYENDSYYHCSKCNIKYNCETDYTCYKCSKNYCGNCLDENIFKYYNKDDYLNELKYFEENRLYFEERVPNFNIIKWVEANITQFFICKDCINEKNKRKNKVNNYKYKKITQEDIEERHKKWYV